MNNDSVDVRSRMAEVIYGDGDELSWNRSVQMADLVIWELGGLRRDRVGNLVRWVSGWKELEQ